MKVYVVIYDYYDILKVLGVFTTRDKALEFATPRFADPEQAIFETTLEFEGK